MVSELPPELLAIMSETATSPVAETAAHPVEIELADHYDPDTKDESDLSSVTIDEHEIMNPPGLVGDIARWITDTAGKPQPLFSLAASLAVCGTIMGRKIRDLSNGRTNIFATIVGESSAGKDYPIKCSKRILSEAGGENLLMGKMQSSQVLEARLSESPHTKLVVLGESGHYFGNLGKIKDGSSCKAEIKPLLMELFSSANGLYIGSEAISRTPPRIDQPHVCTLGDTQPSTYFGCMTRNDLMDGWAARNLTFISNDTTKDFRMIDPGDIPAGIIERVRKWIVLQAVMANGFTANGFKAKPRIVPTTELALSTFVQFGKFAQHTGELRKGEGRLSHYLWSKALEQARRIALIVAGGESVDAPTIDAVEARYGCNLVTRIIQDNERGMERFMSENEWEAEGKRIFAVIEKAGHKGITTSELHGKCRWVKGGANTIRNHLTTLEVHMEPLGGKGGGMRIWTKSNWFWRSKANG